MGVNYSYALLVDRKGEQKFWSLLSVEGFLSQVGNAKTVVLNVEVDIY